MHRIIKILSLGIGCPKIITQIKGTVPKEFYNNIKISYRVSTKSWENLNPKFYAAFNLNHRSYDCHKSIKKGSYEITIKIHLKLTKGIIQAEFVTS